jgi:hypothetical protein
MIPFEMDKLVAALKPAMQCEGGESVTALLETKGNQTHLRWKRARLEIRETKLIRAI